MIIIILFIIYNDNNNSDIFNNYNYNNIINNLILMHCQCKKKFTQISKYVLSHEKKYLIQLFTSLKVLLIEIYDWMTVQDLV